MRSLIWFASVVQWMGLDDERNGYLLIILYLWVIQMGKKAGVKGER